VSYDPSPPPNSLGGVRRPPLHLWSDLVEVGTVWAQPRLFETQGWPFDLPNHQPRVPPNIRIYAGQADPADPSHFTIRYQMWGQEDILDGRLDGHDNVTLTPRHPPTEAVDQ
jgi:hypothetical protein